MTKLLRQQVRLPARPRQVYAALIESPRHAAFTGAPARLVAKPGAPFSCYGGYLTGFTLHLVSGKRIVQAWRSRDWPAGTYSLVTFALAAAPGGQTRLTFTQLGIPAGDHAAKSAGWRTHYWRPLRAYLAR